MNKRAFQIAVLALAAICVSGNSLHADSKGRGGRSFGGRMSSGQSSRISTFKGGGSKGSSGGVTGTFSGSGKGSSISGNRFGQSGQMSARTSGGLQNSGTFNKLPSNGMTFNGGKSVFTRPGNSTSGNNSASGNSSAGKLSGLSKPPFSGSRPLIGSLPSGLTGKPGGGSSAGTGLIKPGTLINPTTRPKFPGLGGIGNPGSGNPGSGNPGGGNPGGGNPGSGNPGSGNPGSGNPGSGNPGSGNPGSGGGAGWGLGGWLHHHHNHCWKPWTGCYGGFHCTTTVQPIILPTTVIIDQPVEIVTQIPATMNPAAAIDLAVRGATLLKIEGEATSRTFQIAIENRGPSDLTVPVRVAIFAVHDGVTTGELPNVTQMLDALPAGTIGTLEMTLPTSAIGANQIVVAIETPEGLTDIDESNNMAQGEIALLPVAVMGSAN